MSLIHDIFDWVKTLPLWQQDAARRLYEQPAGLTDSDYRDLYALALKENNVESSDLIAHPIDESKIPERNGQHSLIIKALGNLRNVNRIDPSQKLEFGTEGMTVVYGDNGSGKSGYARVFKKACFCRDVAETVLPNVTEPNEHSSNPNAEFTIEVDGTTKTIHWDQGTESGYQDLANVSVFDSKVARIVLDSAQELHYIPYGLDILTVLGGTVFPKMKEMVENEMSNLDLSETRFSELRGETSVGRLFADLSRADIMEVRRLGTLSSEDMQRGKELSELLAQTNYHERIRSTDLITTRVKGLLDRIHQAEAILDDRNVVDLQDLCKQYQEAKAAEEIAAKALKGDDALLNGTGNDAWKTMFVAAREFIAGESGECATVSNQQRCPLCQQPLTPEAQCRIKRFEEFVENQIATKLNNAIGRINEARQRLQQQTGSSCADETLQQELSELDASFASQYRQWCSSFESRKHAILSALSGAIPWTSVPSLERDIVNVLERIHQKLQTNKSNMLSAMEQTGRENIEKELAELRTKYRLQKFLPDVEAWFLRLDRHKRLAGILPSLNSTKITKKVKELTVSSVSEPLRKAVQHELFQLGFRLRDLNLDLKTHGEKGKVVGLIEMDVPNQCSTAKVLSEGEQKIVSLSSFLAELKVSGHSHAIVFDDPMTSLDHIHRDKVAKRLAMESKTRQVIIFSHEPVFVTKLISECSIAEVPCKVLSLECIGPFCGCVCNDTPWIHKKWQERINKLEQQQRQLAKTVGSYLSETEKQEMRRAYSQLRATIELVAQEVFLGGTIRRFDDLVHLKQLETIPPFDTSAAKRLYILFGKCSDFTEGHDHASASNASVPMPVEFLSDIQELKDCIDAVKATRNQANRQSTNPK